MRITTARKRRCSTRCFTALVLASFLVLITVSISFVSNDFWERSLSSLSNDESASNNITVDSHSATSWKFLTHKQFIRSRNVRIKGQVIDKFDNASWDESLVVNYDVHVFYYPWYGNPKTDGKYLHWNHRYLADWHPAGAGGSGGNKWPTGRHVPPEDIGASFYPSLGPYSSKDLDVLDSHMKQIRQAGAGVLVVSWYPKGQADDEGENVDSTVPLILDYADKYKLKVCFHVEPYKGRNATTLRADIKYIYLTYGSHPAFYRRETTDGRLLPMYYIYDSYLVSDDQWKHLLLLRTNDGTTVESCIRQTELDALFVGLLVERIHLGRLAAAGFDGAYTYFASDGFTYSSTWRNWPEIARQARQSGLIFIPSVGPGYNDERIRPWNSVNTRHRDGGQYYLRSIEAAFSAAAQIISVTSFNEWGEGTQIETALSDMQTLEGVKYLHYEGHGEEEGGPDMYLRLTRKIALRLHHAARSS